MSVHLSRRGLLAGASAAALLLMPTGAPASAALKRDWRARLGDLERAYDGRIGAFARDTGTGRCVHYRGDERFPLLSTFKAFAGAAVLDRARHQDPGLLDRLIRWTEADLVEYSPVTSQHVADGLTVAELCLAAIAESDNTAGNLILRQIGGPAGLTAYLRRIGDPVSRLDRWETELNQWAPGAVLDTTTPVAAGRDLELLTVGRPEHHSRPGNPATERPASPPASQPGSPPASQSAFPPASQFAVPPAAGTGALCPADQATLISWLRASVTGGARIRAGLPADWTVGDKTGSAAESYGAANDIAIAHPPTGAPLIIAVYTNRNTSGVGYDNAVIAGAATILAEALGRV